MFFSACLLHMFEARSPTAKAQRGFGKRGRGLMANSAAMERSWGYFYLYQLYQQTLGKYICIYIYTIWLFNSSPWKDPPFLMGKPSINGPCSMAMSNNQRIYKLRVCWWLSHQLQHLFLAQALRSFHLLPILDWGWSAQVMTSHS